MVRRLRNRRGRPEANRLDLLSEQGLGCPARPEWIGGSTPDEAHNYRSKSETRKSEDLTEWSSPKAARKIRTAPNLRQGSDSAHNLAVFRKPALRVLREDQPAIGDNVKHPVITSDQFRFDTEFSGERGLQTGGSGKVVSADAVRNRDLHTVPSCAAFSWKALRSTPRIDAIHSTS